MYSAQGVMPDLLNRRARRRMLGRPGRRLVAAAVTVALLASMTGVADVAAAQRASAASTSASSGDVIMVTGSVNSAWWVANALSVNSGQKLTETLYYEQMLMQMYRQNPSLPPVAALREIQALQAAVGKAEKFSPTGSALGDQLVPGFLNVVQKVLDKSPVGKVATEAAKVAFQALSGAAGDSSGVDQVAQAQDMANHALITYGDAQSIFEDVVHLAKDGNPLFRTAQDMIFASTTAPVGATAAQLISANPQLQMLQGINSLIDSNGKIQTSIAQLRQLVTGTMAQILDQQKKAQDTLDEINAKQDVLLDYAHNQAQRQAMADAAAAKAADEQNLLSALGSGVSILSTLIGIADPQFGKAVQIVGSAAIQIGTAVSKFSELAAGVGGFAGALTSMAGAALTGNIIGAALSLLPLFFDSGPTPDQMILDQIGKLREQVQELGQHLDARFSHVDQEIKVVYDQMMDQFQRIDVALGQIQGDVTDMKVRLASLQNELVHFEGGLYGSLSDGFRRPFWAEVDSALGYQRRTGHQLPAPDYTQADSAFYTFATHDAYDQAATGPANRDYSEQNIANELAKYPIAANLNYLAQLPALWGLAPLSASAVPNPEDWYLGARAYIALQMDAPSDAAGNHALQSEIADLSRGGQQLQGVERAVVGGDLTGDVPLNPLFGKLWQRYRDYATAFENDIQNARDGFSGDHHGLDPFAGLGQPLAVANPVTGTNAHCGVAGSLPSAAADHLIDPVLRVLQSYKGSGTADVCVTADWQNVEDRSTGRFEIMTGDLLGTLSVRWTPNGGTPVVLSQTQFGLGSGRCSVYIFANPDATCDLPDPDQELSGKWSTVQSVAATATLQPVNADQVQALQSEATDYLSALRAEYRGRLANAISSGQTALDAGGMTSLAAALRAYAQLGMPGAVASDELLSSLLLGDQAVLDEGEQQRLTRAVLDQADAAAGVDPWPGLKQTIDDRADALRHALSTDLPVARAQQDGSVATATTLWRLASLADTVTSRSARFGTGAAVQSVPATRVRTARTVTLTVRNGGMGPMKVSGVAVTGTAYSLAADSCHTVAGNAACTVRVRFHPTARGIALGTVNVRANTPTGGATLQLKGRGVTG